MAKYRGFSIVLHDVQAGIQTKSDVQDLVQSMNWRQYVIAQEPYPGQEVGKFHIHVFLQLKGQRTFRSMLSDWCSFWKAGRVQVDVAHGPLTSGCKYVVKGLSKKVDKDFDPSPIIMLEKADAQAIAVETLKVTRDDLSRYYCPHCSDGGFSPPCRHWCDMYDAFRSQNPVPPRDPSQGKSSGRGKF